MIITISRHSELARQTHCYNTWSVTWPFRKDIKGIRFIVVKQTWHKYRKDHRFSFSIFYPEIVKLRKR